MQDLKSLSLSEFQNELARLGEPAFRAEQVMEWAYRGVTNFSEMTNLPKALRQKLSEHFFISRLVPSFVSGSEEIERAQTVKFLFLLDDGKEIETVLIPDFKSESQKATHDLRFVASGLRYGVQILCDRLHGFYEKSHGR